jgi:hypothetical protein
MNLTACQVGGCWPSWPSECRGLDDGRTKQPYFIRRADDDPMASRARTCDNRLQRWAMTVRRGLLGPSTRAFSASRSSESNPVGSVDHPLGSWINACRHLNFVRAQNPVTAGDSVGSSGGRLSIPQIGSHDFSSSGVVSCGSGRVRCGEDRLGGSVDQKSSAATTRFHAGKSQAGRARPLSTRRLDGPAVRLPSKPSLPVQSVDPSSDGRAFHVWVST